MHIQKIFVILAFNNQLLESAISLITKIPAVGVKLEDPVRKLLGKTKKAKLSYNYTFHILSQAKGKAARWRWRG